MIETNVRPNQEEERFQLLEELKVIDSDPDKLRRFLEDQYINPRNDDHPDIFYGAALRLTSLTHLGTQSERGEVGLPPAEEAMRAFTSYTRLIAMIHQERTSSRYQDNGRVARRLSGIREELSFHAALTYLSADGLDLITLPTPARQDFGGGTLASDLQLFTPGSERPFINLQVKTNTKTHPGLYHPRIPVLSLKDVLGGAQAVELRKLLHSIGERDDPENGQLELPPKEHRAVMNAGTRILISANEWVDKYDSRVTGRDSISDQVA